MTWNIHPRAAWRVCLGAGLLIVLLTFMSGQQSLAQPCGGLAENYAPIVAFELARSEPDLQAIFGAPGNPCRDEMIARMSGHRRELGGISHHCLHASIPPLD